MSDETTRPGNAAGVETCPLCGVGTRQQPTWDCGLCGFPPDYVEGVTDA